MKGLTSNVKRGYHHRNYTLLSLLTTSSILNSIFPFCHVITSSFAFLWAIRHQNYSLLMAKSSQKFHINTKKFRENNFNFVLQLIISNYFFSLFLFLKHFRTQLHSSRSYGWIPNLLLYYPDCALAIIKQQMNRINFLS